MNKEDIINIIKKFFKKKLDKKLDLFQHNYLDSIILIDFIIFLEKKFKIKIKTNELGIKKFQNLEKISVFIKNKL